ncbi:MAG: hypothetical protein JXX29_14455 [Deltaproteobacteria bacterium]|nr:hypothetical protein [Deltaproteobacteria bacterium]MBN2672881.1 hypothetical protein [Deltaproteobacteria bacterium]
MNKQLTIIAAGVIAFAAISCGVKRYDEPARCEDLSMSFYNEQEPGTITDEQQAAVERFVSLQGEWLTTFSCIGQTDQEARIIISEALQTNVELYEFTENTECEFFGKAVFEAQVIDSGDIDLDDQTFTMTADLIIPTDSGGNLLEANAESQLSQYDDMQSFSFRIFINESGEFVAAKEATYTSEESGTITITQTNECYMTDWIAQ